MIKDITFGQFFPGNSVFHRCDPRMKIILSIIYIAAVFIADNIIAYAVLVIVTIFIVLVSKIPFMTVIKGMKPLLFVIIFTAVINLFWTKGAAPLVHFWIIEIYPEGIVFALCMVVRISSLLVGTSVVLTYTTSPIALTDGMERLLMPLKKIKLPVHEFAMMMTIALRFIPTLIEETDKIMSAQKARGADFSSGNLLKRAKSLIPVFIPLFVSAFRRADDLAIAMESRCYRGGEGRTKMTVTRFRARDWLTLAAFAALTAAMICINIFLPAFGV